MDIGDIYGYSIFANVDNRDGSITGHRVTLSDIQMETIEKIILAGRVIVDSNVSYEVEDDRG